MSAAARFSYTASATWWRLLSRHPGTRAPVYAAPVVFACDYKSDSSTMVDEAGDPFATKQIIFTEQAGITHGDMVLIGVSSLADPVAAGAREIRAVGRSSDTFDRLADDYKLGTI